jgi:hypothetical protein
MAMFGRSAHGRLTTGDAAAFPRISRRTAFGAARLEDNESRLGRCPLCHNGLQRDHRRQPAGGSRLPQSSQPAQPCVGLTLAGGWCSGSTLAPLSRGHVPEDLFHVRSAPAPTRPFAVRTGCLFAHTPQGIKAEACRCSMNDIRPCPESPKRATVEMSRRTPNGSALPTEKGRAAMTIAVTPPIAGQQAPRREVVRRAQPSIVALAWSRCSSETGASVGCSFSTASREAHNRRH